MYPRLVEIPLPFDLFGVDTITLYSFGAMVALAVLTSVWLTRKELDRMYAAGRLKGVRIPVVDNKGRRKSGTQVVSPSALIGTLTIMVVVFGFAGAKLFHILENLGDFFADPAGMVFSSGGFTFYGGLVLAALAIAWYVRSKGLNVPTVADAVAPGLMLAYGIGRIGCHLAGDGDWGIASDPDAKPGWLPMWLWNETYPNRIYDPPDFPASGVFPTPLYEFLMAAVLFGVLWSLRKHPFLPGWLFSLYLVFAGVERFLIEQIRVNNEFDFLGLVVTQAEVISVLMMILGLIGLALTTRKRPQDQPSVAPKPRVASTPA